MVYQAENSFVKTDTRIKNIILIRRIINHFSAGEFQVMQNKIDHYGASDFFLDLWLFLDDQIYNDPLNKYTFFKDITIQYFKHYPIESRQANKTAGGFIVQ